MKKYTEILSYKLRPSVFKDQKYCWWKRKKTGKGCPGNSWWELKLGATLKQVTEREIFEETGIRIKAGEPVYSFKSIGMIIRVKSSFPLLSRGFGCRVSRWKDYSRR
jgi:ADP-ribose pyrophosphatase